MDLQLRDKTALVTGASMRIGRAIAKLLAIEGVRVAAVARRVELMEAMADEAVAAGGVRPVLIRQDIMADQHRPPRCVARRMQSWDMLTFW